MENVDQTSVEASTVDAAEEAETLDTPEKVFAAIAERAGIENLASVGAPRHAWVTNPIDGKRLHIGLNEEFALQKESKTVAVFHDDGGVRVFVAGKTIERWTFNQFGVSASTYVDMEDFVDDLAAEYSTLAFGDEDTDDDDDSTENDNKPQTS